MRVLPPVWVRSAQIQSSNARFDSPTVAVVHSACDEAWRELSATTFFPCQVYEQELRRAQVTRVAAAVRAGERNPQRLKAIAFDSIAA
jgi:hypothetical protein